MRKVSLYAVLCIFMCFNSACLRMPKMKMPKLGMPKVSMPKLSMPKLSMPKLKLFKPGRYLSYQLEPGTRQAEISVSVDKLWKATVYQFRKYQIIESNPEEKTISVVHNNIVYEFKGKSRTKKNSAFTLKAYVIDTAEPKTKEARLMARRIYKKAKSMKFNIKNIVNKEKLD